MTDLVLVLTTISNERADEVARTLVDERLAACVNVHGTMQSTYRWKGRVECDAERQLVIKTTSDRVEALRSRLAALHPYELPEFIVLQAESASAGYEGWVHENTRT